VLTREGSGNGPIDAFVDALNLGIRVHSYEEKAIGHGSDADAIALIEIAADWLGGPIHGVGIHGSIVTASLLAVLSAVNRGRATLAPAQRALAQGELASPRRRSPAAGAGDRPLR
jgi:2-isopropylmalate synthase